MQSIESIQWIQWIDDMLQSKDVLELHKMATVTGVLAHHFEYIYPNISSFQIAVLCQRESDPS